MIRQRQQRLPAVEHATLAIPLPVTPTAAECGALLKALVKHLLFQRAQIPYLYDELLLSVQEQQRAVADAAQKDATAGGGGRCQRRRRTPKGDKRLLKFLCKAEELMGAIDEALHSFGVPRRAFVLLGASTVQPREAYEVLLPPASVGPPPPPPEAVTAAAGEAVKAKPLQEQQQQQQRAATVAGSGPTQPPPPAGGRPRLSRQERLCMLAMRQMVVAGADLPEGTAHRVPCKLFLLLEGGSSGGDRSSASNEGQQHGPPSAPPGFAVKRAFKLGMRKGVHLRLLLGQHPQPEPVPAPQHEQEHHADSNDMERCSSCSEGEGDSGAPHTKHLSQLPDATSQLPPRVQHCDERQQLRHLGQLAAAAAAGATAGNIWYLCRTALKGLNSGSSDDGATADFDGI